MEWWCLVAVSSMSQWSPAGPSYLRKVCDPLLLRTLNRSGTLTIRQSRLTDDNTTSEIASMVDKVKFSKPKVQVMADCVQATLRQWLS
jgi:hypothetical protein